MDLNATDSDGWTALMYAVTVGDAVCVEKLVKAGADISICLLYTSDAADE